MNRTLVIKVQSDDHQASTYEAMRRMKRQFEANSDPVDINDPLDRGLIIAAICREYLDRPVFQAQPFAGDPKENRGDETQHEADI